MLKRNSIKVHSLTARTRNENRLAVWVILEFFCVRQVYLTNSCLRIWECVNQPFIRFIHHIWDETVLFIIQTSDRMQSFTIFQDKLHSVNIQDDQLWAFSETVQKISKITHTASRFSFLVRAVSEWTLIELRFNIITNLLLLFFVL